MKKMIFALLIGMMLIGFTSPAPAFAAQSTGEATITITEVIPTFILFDFSWSDIPTYSYRISVFHNNDLVQVNDFPLERKTTSFDAPTAGIIWPNYGPGDFTLQLDLFDRNGNLLKSVSDTILNVGF